MSQRDKEEEIFRIYNEIVKAYKEICRERKYSAEELLNYAAHNYLSYIDMDAQLHAQGSPADDRENTIINYLKFRLGEMNKRGRSALSTGGVNLGVNFVFDSITDKAKESALKKNLDRARETRYKDIKPFRDKVRKKWDEMKANQKSEQLKKSAFAKHWAKQLMKNDDFLLTNPEIIEERLSYTIERNWLRGK